jgi:hypothetical protein
MPRNPSPSEIQRQLDAWTEEYEALKSRVRDIGFVCTGSLYTRWMVCGKPNCRCRSNPEQRHGPYYQLTWKEGGITIARRLSAEHAKLYQEWIANRQRLDALLSQMHRISRKAARQLLRASSDPSSTSEEPPRRSRSRKKR